MHTKKNDKIRSSIIPPVARVESEAIMLSIKIIRNGK
jgi:hypothetical protein